MRRILASLASEDVILNRLTACLIRGMCREQALLADRPDL
jgi:hypothetical protein